MIPVAGIDPTTATFILAILVLAAGLWLALAALKGTDNASQQAFAAVGVLFGLLAAGGLGGIFANQAAKSASEATASQTETVTEQVSEELQQLDQKVDALKLSANEANGGGEKENGQAGGAGGQAGGASGK
jgi:thiol:disulfide interchange protein